MFLVRERAIAGAAGLPLDDSWIHLHFARNIAEGAGFSYNPGVPVSGSTAPLWTVVLGLGVAVLGASLATVKVLGVAAAVTAALVSRRAAVAWGATPPVALGAGIALVWAGPMVWGALSGMEVSLAALLVAAALLAHARDHPPLVALLAALAALARPEALLLAPLLVLARPLTLRRVLVFTAIVAAVLAPAVAFSLATVGSPVPATAASKVEGGFLGWLIGVRDPPALLLWERPFRFFRAWMVWLTAAHWLLPPALLAALALVWRRHGRVLGLPALVLVAHPIGMALLAPHQGPGFQEGRYSTHLLPVAVVVLAAALGTLGGHGRRTLAVVFLAVALAALPPHAERYARAVQNINDMQVHLGRWVDANLPRSARLALNDIGAIAFFSRREIIDLMGLVTPEILPYRRRGERGVMDYLQAACPEYVIIFPTWFPEMTAQSTSLEPIYRVRLTHNLVSGGPEMIVYRLQRCEL